MTHNTQGGIATTNKATKQCAEWLSYCVSIGWDKSQLDELEKLWWKYHDEKGNLIKSKSPLPASPEGTWETEFEKLYAKKNYYNLVSFVQSIFQPLQQENKELKEGIRIEREKNINVTKLWQTALQENERLKGELKEAYERLNDITGSLTNSVDENFKLTEQLAEAREALDRFKQSLKDNEGMEYE